MDSNAWSLNSCVGGSVRGLTIKPPTIPFYPPPLPSPLGRLCRNVILRHQPKNLCFPTHWFYEILHFVQNDRYSVSSYYDTVSGGEREFAWKELAPMKKWTGLFLTLTLLTSFLLGCAGTSKDTRIRCSKCGSFYDTREGEDIFKWMRGR